MVKVLFVCTGNICRSPTAHGVFRALVRREGLDGVIEVESAGTNAYHVGQPADRRSVEAAMRRGIDISDLRARQVAKADFHEFDLLLAMDQRNESDLIDLGFPRDRVKLFRSFDRTLADAVARGDNHLLEVPDPYYGGHDGFDKVYAMLWRASEGLLDSLKKR